MFDPSRDDVRRFLCGAWAKRGGAGVPTALETMAIDWISLHPEYHEDFGDLEAALQANYDVDSGRTNPFLHLSMHLAISEQISIDQPRGIAALNARLRERHGDAHAAQHDIMECLGEIVWRAQRTGQPLDEAAYLDCLRRRASA